MQNKIAFIGKLAYFEGRAYLPQDIEMLGDMRRKGVQGGTLVGDELEAFIVACLRTPDYQIFGWPMTRTEHEMVDKLLLTAA